jgi:aminopeptidase N
MNKTSLLFISFLVWYLLPANTILAYTHADSLRGSNGNGRNWWDVQRYELNVHFDIPHKSISGYNKIDLLVTSAPHDSLQLDLQEPMIMDSVVCNNKALSIAHEGNVWWVLYPFKEWAKNSKQSIIVYYHGVPKEAKLPPWEGGFVWSKDSTGKDWVAVACQGLGASCWWPCKDDQGDEPDKGQDIYLTAPATFTCVSNGKLIAQQNKEQQETQWHWQVKNPINTYDITFYLGDYIHWADTIQGEKGTLQTDFYALRYNEQKARKQFAVVKSMLHCYEYWMGPFPWYEDGYKLVEAPYLGMEHQSAVAYGNAYKTGYKGTDRSKTDIGLSFDYIIIHESAHEWWGNNVTAKDVADNWIHEGITTYAESLFVECMSGKEKGKDFCKGEWSNIRNDKPIIGDYLVNDDGSSDKYDKGAALMYMIRTMMHDDEKFRQMLRGMSSTFYHTTVTTQQIEAYINQFSGINFTSIFDQYLRVNNIPILEYYIKKGKINYRFSNALAGFTLPIQVNDGSRIQTIYPNAEWQSMRWNGGYDVSFIKDYLFTEK